MQQRPWQLASPDHSATIQTLQQSINRANEREWHKQKRILLCLAAFALLLVRLRLALRGLRPAGRPRGKCGRNLPLTGDFAK